MTPMERAGYLAQTRTPGHRKRLQAAMGLIAAHPDYAVGVSWGKDSMCVLHMAYSLGIRKAVHVRYHPQARFPDSDEIRDRTLEMMPELQYLEVPCESSWDVYDQAGRFFLEAETDEEKALVRAYEGKFQAAIAQGQQQLGAAGSFGGMRADESRARFMLTRTKGDDYTTRDGRRMALPLANWSGEDVWGHIVVHNLPWLRIYDYSARGNRSRERSEPAFAVTGGVADAIRRHGAWQSWQAAYPDWWAAWVARWPEIHNFMV